MSRVDPKLPIPTNLFDDPAKDLFYPDSYMDRLVRRLDEILRQRDTLVLERSGPVLTGVPVPSASAMVQVVVDGVTYYLLAAPAP